MENSQAGFAMNIPIEQMEPATSVGQIWKPGFVIYNNPTAEGVVADAFEGEQWC